MTSIALRKLALAGAAVASLGIAACSKPAATNDTNTATATDNGMSNSMTSSDNSMSGASNMTNDTTSSNNTAS